MNNNIIYISHGGGPLPLLGDPDHQEMVSTLKMLSQKIAKPSAILVISAHWEATEPTVTSGANPSLIYDYGGFPEESYSIQYPCAGEPDLASQVHQKISSAGIKSKLNPSRGFDHGLFVPLKIMYPDADIPCVQLSLVHTLDAQQHIAIGKALSQLQWDNLLVVGSGFSFHNMRSFFYPELDQGNHKNQAFEHWLKSTMMDNELSETQRTDRLVNWQQAPHARFCHPREEHLLPLHVCYGMAGKAADHMFVASIIKKQSSMFLWQAQEL